MARRKFDKQFKNSAVKLILEEGYSVKEVSQELEVHANSLYRWVQEVEEYGIKNPNQLKRFLLMNSPEVNGNRVLNIVDLLNGKNKAFSLDTDKGQDDAINHKSMENLKESRDTMKQEQDKEIQRNTNNNFSIKYFKRSNFS